jgi:hypothetical protein
MASQDTTQESGEGVEAIAKKAKPGLAVFRISTSIPAKWAMGQIVSMTNRAIRSGDTNVNAKQETAVGLALEEAAADAGTNMIGVGCIVQIRVGRKRYTGESDTSYETIDHVLLPLYEVAYSNPKSKTSDLVAHPWFGGNESLQSKYAEAAGAIPQTLAEVITQATRYKDDLRDPTRFVLELSVEKYALSQDYAGRLDLLQKFTDELNEYARAQEEAKSQSDPVADSLARVRARRESGRTSRRLMPFDTGSDGGNGTYNGGNRTDKPDDAADSIPLFRLVDESGGNGTFKPTSTSSRRRTGVMDAKGKWTYET